MKIILFILSDIFEFNIKCGFYVIISYFLFFLIWTYWFVVNIFEYLWNMTVWKHVLNSNNEHLRWIIFPLYIYIYIYIHTHTHIYIYTQYTYNNFFSYFLKWRNILWYLNNIILNYNFILLMIYNYLLKQYFSEYFDIKNRRKIWKEKFFYPIFLLLT